MVAPPEECDDGNMQEGDGCDNDCTFSCKDPLVDCPPAPECALATCQSDHTCGTLADPAQDGASCGVNGLCKTGVCAPIVCGDGLVEGSEQCDFGAGNGPNTGCEVTCIFSCTTMPDSCPDMSTCNGVETCEAVIVNSSAGQACLAGQPEADCSMCAAGVCMGGACLASTCGDGCVDAAVGEQCEPAGTLTCDAMCQDIVCGNGIRQASEQCDDGNTTNLDGCDSACAFEQDQRSNTLTLMFGTDAYCALNKFGAAIAPVAQSIIQGQITTGVNAGSNGFLFKVFGLDDLTGSTDDPTLQLGVVSANPVPGPGYTGASDLDWWYTVVPLSIDATRTPIDQLPANILGGFLNAGPGSMTIAVTLFAGQGFPTLLRLSSVKLQIGVGPSGVPLASAMGTPPGHLPAEQLDPALTSFSALGTMMPGKLCSNMSAQSFAQASIPPALLPGGMFACQQNYAQSNSLLDVLVTGCTIQFVGPVVNPSQPDQVDPGVPPAGTGGPYTLQTDAQKVVTTCRDASNQIVDLNTCLSAAAYSSYFQLTTDRVIVK
jgi:cysteine-rich repeat protein